MIYTVQNTAASPRVFYDTRQQEITLAPGVMRHVDLDPGTLERLLARNDLLLTPATFERHAPRPAAPPPIASEVPRPSIAVTGHFGIGDNLHQRAVMRSLMQSYDVWLYTCHFEIFHDLIAQGLKLVLRPTHLHAQAKTIERERGLFEQSKFPPPPSTARQAKIGYPAVLVHQHGSILEAMFSCVGLKMPEKPDFSLPIKDEWKDSLRQKYQWETGGKPLMVHRPVVVRQEWDGRSRNPEPGVYDEIYRSIRDQFFVVSVADLAAGREWIEGPHQQVDVALHRGELSFPEMAALWSAADLVYCNAGFAPVLAQAVGTSVICVYGGRESYKTTQRVGAHLAPTLPIDPITPCDCHSATHRCDKRIDLARAQDRVRAAAVGLLNSRAPGLPPTVAAQTAGPSHTGIETAAVTALIHRSTLIFGTFYIDSPDRDNLTELWKKLHTTLNDDCDFLAVDSQSPIQKFADWTPYDGTRHKRMYFNFPDNIGHLSRAKTTPGNDGWGRAFCKGLEVACELGYSHVAHIEGDSLFRLRVSEITRQMSAEGIDCATTEVQGLRQPQYQSQWVETGLMFFSTDYIKRSNFIWRYDWPNRRVAPTPERYIRMEILNRDLNAKQFRVMPWKAYRADKNQITKDNICGLNLDWVTHQHDSAQQDVYKKFVEAALAILDLAPTIAMQESASAHLKLNLGCGTNKLPGWENHDSDVDITKPLPFPGDSVSHIFAEHVVEHITYKQAIELFKEAHRVLASGGCLRVTVPSLEQIAQCDDSAYHQFTTKWQKLGPNKRGAMHSIIYAHGHEAIWNSRLLRDVLYFAGFDDVRPCKPGQSDDPVLRGVEGHGRVIGDKFNLIESCTVEARKNSHTQIPKLPVTNSGTIAVIIGGATCWQEDLERARKLVGDKPTRFFVVNDQIASFPEPCVACTLHPDKLAGAVAWLAHRQRAGLPEPEQVWSHRKAALVTHDTATKDWGGSSGLFAIQVAIGAGHRKVIAAGVPMTVEGGHYLRPHKWQSAISFRQGWARARNEIAPYFRSMSGWTAEQFGVPDENWLAS